MTCPRKQGSMLLSVIRSLKGVIWCHRLRKHRSDEPKRRTNYPHYPMAKKGTTTVKLLSFLCWEQTCCHCFNCILEVSNLRTTKIVRTHDTHDICLSLKIHIVPTWILKITINFCHLEWPIIYNSAFLSIFVILRWFDIWDLRLDIWDLKFSIYYDLRFEMISGLRL